MAFTFKLGGVWYVRYKDEAGHWQKKSCGKDAKKSEAEYLANEYTASSRRRVHTRRPLTPPCVGFPTRRFMVVCE
jgi:hypothetical protein